MLSLRVSQQTGVVISSLNGGLPHQYAHCLAVTFLFLCKVFEIIDKQSKMDYSMVVEIANPNYKITICEDR